MFDSLGIIGKALMSLGWGALCAVMFIAGLGVYCLIRLLMDGRRLRERQREQEHRRRVEDDDTKPYPVRHEDRKTWEEEL